MGFTRLNTVVQAPLAVGHVLNKLCPDAVLLTFRFIRMVH